MEFDLEKSIEVLARTPKVLEALLQNLSEDWTMENEGGETWSAYDILGHLIHGEKTDWLVRIEIILSENNKKDFKPFDRFAQFEESKSKTLEELLKEFRILREKNIQELRSRNISKSDLKKTGIHPAFGKVTLAELVSTWTVHDLNHLSQIGRVMSKQYMEAVGPWKAYLRVLNH